MAEKTFTDEERAAMRERAKEQKTRRGGKTDGAADVLAKIAEMTDADRAMASRIHELITTNVPELEPRTWYGMPAYGRAGKVVCFFQSGAKFKTRYATFGFSDRANLDDGPMWPNAYAISELTPAVEERLLALVRQAVS
jgi:hypothetical protein